MKVFCLLSDQIFDFGRVAIYGMLVKFGWRRR